jgi:hypothetical protein
MVRGNSAAVAIVKGGMGRLTRASAWLWLFEILSGCQNARCNEIGACSDGYGEGTARVMRLLEYLVEMFIQGFGITRPSEAQRKRVTLLLGGALLTAGLLAIIVVVGMVFYLRASH